ncbi:hypothetical protein [Bartonella sp. LJL80]
MKIIFKSLVAISLLSCTLTNNAYASDSDADFFRSIEGNWSGPGEVVAGKYKGTKFTCNFAGTSEVVQTGMTLDGNCRVGVFSQPMKATVLRGPTGFSGAFNDGSKGEGLDVISGKVGSDHMVFGLNRKQLNGAMMARLADKNSMNITVSVKIENDLIPVVGMKLKRTSDLTRDVAKK